MRSSETAAGVAVEEFVKQHIIAELRVLLLDWRVAKDRAMTVRVAEKDAAQPASKLLGNFAEMQHRARSHRAFDPEVVAIIAVKPLQRLDEEKVDRHPDRTTPVRVAAKHSGGRVTGSIADAQPGAGMLKDIRVLAMQFG